MSFCLQEEIKYEMKQKKAEEWSSQISMQQKQTNKKDETKWKKRDKPTGPAPLAENSNSKYDALICANHCIVKDWRNLQTADRQWPNHESTRNRAATRCTDDVR